jgi:putative ABC transport system substrate-binding protein
LYRLGYLGSTTAPTPLGREDAYLQGLRDYGYVEGQNLIIERRYYEGRPDRLATLVAELVGLPVDIIFAGGGTIVAIAASEATRTIPIVTATGDLVGTGLVESLPRPGGNVTGLTSMSAQLSGKRLELLKATVPSASHVAAIVAAINPTARINLQETQLGATALGLAIHPLDVRDPSELEAAFEAARGLADAVLVLGGFSFTFRNEQFAEFAARSGLPTMYQEREYVEDGGLMSYGPNYPAQYRRAAYFVDRILRGAQPADLPVEQPKTFDFVVNLKTAQALGLTFPEEIRLQVTEVIQ